MQAGLFLTPVKELAFLLLKPVSYLGLEALGRQWPDHLIQNGNVTLSVSVHFLGHRRAEKTTAVGSSVETEGARRDVLVV